MSEFVAWNSQPLADWAERYASGEFIDLAGRRTHFVARGQGKPVILIHGFNLDLHTWTKNLDPLAAQFRVCALDLWGQGYSTRQPLPYGYELFEEQVRLFMEALDIGKASLVGHSMGGGTAIVFARRHPEPDHDSKSLTGPAILQISTVRMNSISLSSDSWAIRLQNDSLELTAARRPSTNPLGDMQVQGASPAR